MACEPVVTTDFDDLVEFAAKISGNPYPVHTGHLVRVGDVWPGLLFRVAVLPAGTGSNPEAEIHCVVRGLRVPKTGLVHIWAIVHSSTSPFQCGSDIVDCGAYFDIWTPSTNFSAVCSTLAGFVHDNELHEQIEHSGTRYIHVHRSPVGHNWKSESFTVNLEHQTLHNAVSRILADIYGR